MKIPNKALIDLHIHLDGSLPFELVRELAAAQGMAVMSDSQLRRLMTVSSDCMDLNEYLSCFDYPLSLLQTEDALEKSVYRLLQVQSFQGMIYSEIRFAPQLHTRYGLNQKQVVDAALRGIKRFQETFGSSVLESNLIFCCMRGAENIDSNLETIEIAGPLMGHGVAALDLAGAEALFPTSDFEILFKKVKEKGIPFTIHAGEAAGAESIWKALEFGASRIGHGVRCIEDKVLVDHLVKSGIILELCPTSNMNTKIFDSIRKYPLPALMEAGVKVTINTDNMTVSGTTVRKELQLMADTFHLDKGQIKILLRNSVDGAFTSEEIKHHLRKEIDNIY